VAVIYNGSDTVTSCSYTTPPDSTQRDEGFARTRLGYIPLLAYGWSLTTWVVKVTLLTDSQNLKLGSSQMWLVQLMRLSTSPTPLAMASHPPSEAGIGLRR
jgi:hypothetical protein